MAGRLARVALLFTFAGALLAVVPPAFACSCAWDSSPESITGAIEQGDGGIFVGTVIGKRDVGRRSSVVVMQVERVIKGEFGPIVDIHNWDRFADICGGWDPAVGGRIGLFVEGSPTEGWTAGGCSLVLEPGYLLEIASSTRPPDPDIGPFGPFARSPWVWMFRWISIAAITVLLIAGLRFLLVRRRRRVSY